MKLGQAPAVIKGGLSDRLDLWIKLAAQRPENAANAHITQDIRDQALALRDIRNLIVHGLIGGDAQPSNNAPASIRCAIGGFEAPTGEFKTYVLADLEHFIQGIDACRRGLIDLDNFDYRIQPSEQAP